VLTRWTLPAPLGLRNNRVLLLSALALSACEGSDAIVETDLGLGLPASSLRVTQVFREIAAFGRAIGTQRALAPSPECSRSERAIG
jgi:hypothetical protein